MNYIHIKMLWIGRGEFLNFVIGGRQCEKIEVLL
jgi:hypothetical protein